MATDMPRRPTPEKLGSAYRWRVDALGDVYEYVHRGLYQKRITAQAVRAVSTAPHDVFLKIPDGYALVHDCVLAIGCAYCGAARGKRCRNNGLEHSYTHWMRRRDATKRERTLK